MAAMVYPDPFGSALAGKRAALKDFLDAAKTGSDLQGSNLQNEYLKWYLPVKQQEAQLKQQQAQQEFQQQNLQNLARLAPYANNYQPFNEAVAQQLGIDPASIPQSFAPGKQALGAFTGAGILPSAFLFPNVQSAGGVQLDGNYGVAADPNQKKLQELSDAVRLAELQQYYSGLTNQDNQKQASQPTMQDDIASLAFGKNPIQEQPKPTQQQQQNFNTNMQNAGSNFMQGLYGINPNIKKVKDIFAQ